MEKKIAILTSGGDAPGMNAAIRAAAKTAMAKGMKVYGIQRGYLGMLMMRYSLWIVDTFQE